MFSEVSEYFRKHPVYNSITHLSLGIGIGAILTYPYFTDHPVRWGAVFLIVGLFGHIFPMMGGSAPKAKKRR
ncbi:MAG: hypothetical protein Q7S03_00725 [bacterium]|nr:hypothetical protein [bacterium]